MEREDVWSSRSVTWLAEIAVLSAGLACCVTLLNLASRVIMGLGGFVAVGGPYAIEHPAPEWVALVPTSILCGFLFGGVSVPISSKAGGFSLVTLVWIGLFVSLGWQFAVMAFNPPGGEGIAWGWVICAVVFFPMGLAPLPGLLRGQDIFGLGMAPPWADHVFKPYEDTRYKAAYIASVAVGVAGGVVGGLALFAAVAR